MLTQVEFVTGLHIFAVFIQGHSIRKWPSSISSRWFRDSSLQDFLILIFIPAVLCFCKGLCQGTRLTFFIDSIISPLRKLLVIIDPLLWPQKELHPNLYFHQSPHHSLHTSRTPPPQAVAWGLWFSFFLCCSSTEDYFQNEFLSGCWVVHSSDITVQAFILLLLSFHTHNWCGKHQVENFPSFQRCVVQ